MVYVFDTETGLEVDVLSHADRGAVQTIAVSNIYVRTGCLTLRQSLDSEDTNMIASASSSNGGRIYISLWINQTRKVNACRYPSQSSALWILFQFTIAMATLIFLYQNTLENVSVCLSLDFTVSHHLKWPMSTPLVKKVTSFNDDTRRAAHPQLQVGLKVAHGQDTRRRSGWSGHEGRKARHVERREKLTVVEL
jgi:hypothetical protein